MAQANQEEKKVEKLDYFPPKPKRPWDEEIYFLPTRKPGRRSE